ncbi:MAG: hypothetical protein IKB97_00605, partial [Bacteroidaceae bacterium]|nr:hypothetical protein [Bacteroidaceae bacterium]
MKKCLLMLISGLCALVGFAQTQVTDLSQLSNDKVYTLRSARAFLLHSTANGISGQLCSSTGKLVGNVTLDNSNPDHQFRIEKKGAQYYLYSVGAEKYVSSSGSYEANPSSPLVFEKVGTGNYMWKLSLGGNYMNSQESGQMDAGIVLDSWSTTDAGNSYCIEEGVLPVKGFTVTVLGTTDANAGVSYNGTKYANGGTFESEGILKKADLTATEVDGKMAVVNIDGGVVYVSYFDKDTKFYTIQNGLGGYASLNSEYMSGGYLTITNTNEPQDNKGIWAFVKQSNNVYKIYNYSLGLSKVLGITGSEANARTQMVALDNTAYKTEFSGTFNLGSDQPSYIRINGTNNNYWNKRGDYLALWNNSGAVGDNGSKFFIKEVNYADYPDEYYYEVSNIEGISSYTPKNPNTLWYRTSAEAAGVGYPWMEYALP